MKFKEIRKIIGALIYNAIGDLDFIPKVSTLVAVAPTIEDWETIIFKSAQPYLVIIRFNPLEIILEIIIVSSLNDSYANLVGIQVCFKY